MVTIYFTTDGNNHLTGQGSTPSTPQDIELDVPDNHEVLLNPFIFKYVNGELVKDTVYQQHLITQRKAREAEPTLEEQLSSVKKQNADLAFELMMKGVL
jgi:hypothetical protein